MYISKNTPDQVTLQLGDFAHPLGSKLDSKNRWVIMSDIIPWDALEGQYSKLFSPDTGPKALSFRIALGSLIVKEMLNLSDEATIEQITENPYIQYFLGFPNFQSYPPFTSPMLTLFRKRINISLIKHINESVIKEFRKNQVPEVADELDSSLSQLNSSSNDINQDEENEISAVTPQTTHHGKLLIDATCAPSDVRYPTDISLLNEARQKTEIIIDILWDARQDKNNELKPRTYREIARKEFISIIKKRKISKTLIRKGIRAQLEHLKRNLNHISTLKNHVNLNVLSKREYQNLLVISLLYSQQSEMYDKRVHSIANRIVSISQPHIRPIVRGKAASAVEFGAKISVSNVDGFMYLDRLEWESYHEGEDLILQAEAYKNRFGFWPKSIHADKAYGTQANRKWCKENGIKLSGPQLGRPKKITDENREELLEKKRQLREDERARIPIEGSFGVAKRRFGLGLIMAKLSQTSETMIALALLLVNLTKILRCIFLSLFSTRQYYNLGILWRHLIRVSTENTGNIMIFFEFNSLLRFRLMKF